MTKRMTAHTEGAVASLPTVDVITPLVLHIANIQNFICHLDKIQLETWLKITPHYIYRQSNNSIDG